MSRENLRDNLKEAMQIIRYIITQPLEVEANKKSVSLLEASKNVNDENSDLKKILTNFIRYPESTERLLQELEILNRDLRL